MFDVVVVHGFGRTYSVSHKGWSFKSVCGTNVKDQTWYVLKHLEEIL